VGEIRTAGDRARAGYRRCVRRDSIVLCYHAVSPTWPCSLAVTPERLERQLSSLIRRGWVGATFTQTVLDPPAKRTLSVTFDDAFASVLEHALPILDVLGLPGTVFAPTAFMSHRQPLTWPGIERWAETPHARELTSMDWDDLGTLADSGWEIGSHTHTHPHLTQLDDDRLSDELSRSHSDCSERLGRDCTSIAYPYGDVDERVARLAREVGYSAGAALGRSLRRSHADREPRIGIYNVDTPWRFRLKVAAPSRRMRERFRDSTVG
jgi:peptidoglycan/xylan/chitin deacetylase (PgdA/CDA1 family)